MRREAFASIEPREVEKENLQMLKSAPDRGGYEREICGGRLAEQRMQTTAD